MARHLIELKMVDGRATVCGECDLATAGQIEAWLGTFDSQPVEVDLSGVTFFDSTALRTFLNIRRRKPNIRIVEASAAVRRVLEITGTGDYLLDGSGE